MTAGHTSAFFARVMLLRCVRLQQLVPTTTRNALIRVRLVSLEVQSRVTVADDSPVNEPIYAADLGAGFVLGPQVKECLRCCDVKECRDRTKCRRPDQPISCPFMGCRTYELRVGFIDHP